MHRAATKIRQWRKSQRPPLSASDLAAKVGISPTLAYRIENGSRPHGDVMARIHALGACAPEDWFPEDAQAEGRAA
jgi:transcriptional regulator with XRE-family HTH domain